MLGDGGQGGALTARAGAVSCAELMLTASDAARLGRMTAMTAAAAKARSRRSLMALSPHLYHPFVCGEMVRRRLAVDGWIGSTGSSPSIEKLSKHSGWSESGAFAG
jgi:hypothetical protein